MMIFVPAYDTIKKDATNVFIPEAHKLAQVSCKNSILLQCDEESFQIIKINNKHPMKDRAIDVLRYISTEPVHSNIDEFYDVFVFLCHGWSNGIQLGFRSRPNSRKQTFTKEDKSNWNKLVHTISHFSDSPTVVLYCCSTGDSAEDRDDEAPGSGDNSFADQLRDDLCHAGAVDCRVVAHYTAGHATQNPHIKIFEGRGSPYGGVGADSLTKQGTVQHRALKRLLKTDWRFQFPFMDITTITQEIQKNC